MSSDDDHPRFKHGLFQSTENFTHEEKLRVLESAQGYMDELGGEDVLTHSQSYDCHLLAVTEFRIARAEGIMYEQVGSFLEEETPEKNLDRLVNRRQDLRKDLGLLDESPEAREADASEAFFEALDETE